MTITNKAIELAFAADQVPLFSADGLYIIFKGVYFIGGSHGVDKQGETSICLFKTKHGFYLRGLIEFKGQTTSMTICLGLEPKLADYPPFNSKFVVGAACGWKARDNSKIDNYKGHCLYDYDRDINDVRRAKVGPPNFEALPITLLDLVSFAS